MLIFTFCFINYLFGLNDWLFEWISNAYSKLLYNYKTNNLQVILTISAASLVYSILIGFSAFILIPKIFHYKFMRLVTGVVLLAIFFVIYLFIVNYVMNQSFYYKPVGEIHFYLGILCFIFFQLFILYGLCLIGIGPSTINKVKSRNTWMLLFFLTILLIASTVYIKPESNRLKAFLDTQLFINKHFDNRWLNPLFGIKQKQYYSNTAASYCKISNTKPDYKMLNDDPPNIFIISFDALRADVASDGSLTPHLNDFYKGAHYFVNNYSHGTHTPSSISSINTSKYFADIISANEDTLASILSENGYKTMLFIGKLLYNRHFIMDMAFIDGKTLDSPIVKGIQIRKEVEENDIKSDLFIFNKCCRQIEIEHKFNYPLFVWFHIYNIHETPISFMYKSIISKEPFKKEYLRRVKLADQMFGDYIHFLKDNNLYDKSMIIVFSDHGDEIKDHGGFYHTFSLYNELIKVPLAIKLPYQKEGKQYFETVSSIDIMPTVLDYLKISLKKTNLCGESLLPLINNRDNPHKLPVSAFYRAYKYFSPKAKHIKGAVQMSSDPKIFNVRKLYKYSIVSSDNEWKLIETLSPHYFELYNLNTDPEERINLADEKPDIVKDLKIKLHKQIRTD